MKRVLLLSSSFIAFVAADYACSRSNAIAWPASGNILDNSTPGSCVSNCNGDSACIALCEAGQCNAVGCGDDDGLIIDDGVNNGDGGLIKKRSSEKRQSSLNCADSDACYLYTDGDLLCVNMQTGDYTDSSGGNGNAITGAYTASSGDTQTVAAGETGTGLAGTSATSTRTSTNMNTASSRTQSSTAASITAAAAETNGAMSSASSIVGVVGSGFGILINLLL